ncbi:YbaB/EbfC family nucleoid-associated protein [Amycolatopsis carbonis]|uniref:YbaB/EbfC family nucleoid-associated protein n=1 Tax=Amycolatopsis carbonis TaxID=715471 RepID=A0A9Y2MVJ2_9PSEU|nr:YbaB/EbfC family nucleoid-associated protein [Amycolatopsis sp. 2-15]WIX76959.1 YbaB/EbfC family nucleoid-associated protein [Amycolatopsis sp. 2-15]
MTAPRRDLRLMQQQAGELDAQLAAARHAARSADQLVNAIVTGQGKLVDLRIDDRALRGAHAQKLGVGIVDAIRNARNHALASSLPQLNALFGKQPPPPAATGPAPQRHATAPEPAHYPPEPDDDQSFEELDFLTDKPEPEGGRW